MVDPKPDGLIFDTCKDIPGVSAERRQAFAAGPASRAVHSRLAAEIGALRDIELQQPPAPAPALGALAKVAFWNLERCKHLETSAELLAAVAADISLLTELDLGMARSGQRHTTRDLAGRLNQGYAFGVEFVELGLGNERERHRHAGEKNIAGMHGAAILSPSPLTRPALCRLETDGDWFDGTRGERRVGGRIALAATIPVGGVDVGFFSVHFESHGDPRQRGAQMRVLLAAVEAYAGKGPVIIGGDFNSGTATLAEARDPKWRAAVVAEDPRRFVFPIPYEPLFDAAVAAGFDWHDCNRQDPTQRFEKDGPPASPGRLDWFFTRGLVAERPVTVPAVAEDAVLISDHDLIAVTIRPERSHRLSGRAGQNPVSARDLGGQESP